MSPSQGRVHMMSDMSVSEADYNTRTKLVPDREPGIELNDLERPAAAYGSTAVIPTRKLKAGRVQPSGVITASSGSRLLKKEFREDLGAESEDGEVAVRQSRDAGFLSNFFGREDSELASTKGKIMPKSDDEEELKQRELDALLEYPEPILKMQDNMKELHRKVDRLDTSAGDMEDLFYREIKDRIIQIDNLEDADLEKHQELFEMNELKRLEK